MTSSFENPNMKLSLLSIRTTSTPPRNSADSLAVSSRPPKPAPSTTTLITECYSLIGQLPAGSQSASVFSRSRRIRAEPVRRAGMTDTMNEPISTRNLDRYGHAELPWSRSREILATDWTTTDLTFFVATVRPDGRPHSAGVGAAWVDGELYFTSGPGTLKSRNLATNSACTVSVRLPGIDLVLEGEAHRVTDPSTVE